MPYQVYEQDGRFCVHKKNPDDSMGELVPGGCHPTHAAASAHMKALYVHVEDASKEMILFGAKTFEELDEEFKRQNKEMQISELIGEFDLLLKNIMATEDEDKEDQIKALSQEFAERVMQVTGDDKPKSRVAEIVEATLDALHINKKKEEDNPILIWKEADGGYKWLIDYSNNFEDEDTPPDTISAKSHRRFVEKVDKGLAPLPELLLWHVPQWKIGKANAVAYDESGFAIAMGRFDKGLEPVAEFLSKQKDSFAASHGMPISTVVRDEQDPSVIVEHETREISLLPRWAAANKRTSLVVLGSEINKEDEMSIPNKKKEELIARGISPDVLEKLEMANKADAEAALAEGVKSKEADETATETPQEVAQEAPTEEIPAVSAEAVVPETPAVEESEVSPADLPPTRAEVAEAVANVINPLLQEITQSISALSKEIEALKANDEDKIKESLMATPSASIAALVAQRINKQTSNRTPVADGDPLKESKPDEAPAEPPKHVIGIPFLDKMRSEEPDRVGRLVTK